MAVQTEELAKLKAHRWQVSCLEFHADGYRLATAGWDKVVHIWDLNNLQPVNTLKGAHRAPITDLSYWCTPQGELLCTGSSDHTAVLWNPNTGAQVKTLAGHSGWVLGTSFSSSMLATASWDKTIGIWDPNTGQHVHSYTDHTEGVWSVDFHPHSSEILCSASEDGTVKTWDLREDKPTRNLAFGHSNAVYCAKWSPYGTMIASGSADTKICIWDPDSGLVTNTIYGHSDTVKSLVFNPNPDAAMPVLASAGDCTLLISDPRPTQKAEILSLSPHNLGKEVEAVGISPDGSLLVSGGRDGLLVLMTLSVPSLRPQPLNDSVSDKLRNSEYLDQSLNYDSIEDLTEAISQTSTSEGDLSTAASRENITEADRRLPRGSLRDSNLRAKSGFKKQDGSRRGELSARVSRMKRAEKKVVDLPTMIAHLSASLRDSVVGEQPSSSDDSEDEETKQEQKKIISNLIDVAQKVDQYSHVSGEEGLHQVPGQRLSLLPENVPGRIRQTRKVFESPDTTDGDDIVEAGTSNPMEDIEYYDGYASLIPGEEEDSVSDTEESGHYVFDSFQTEHKDTDNLPVLLRNSSRQQSLGSGDEYYDDLTLSMI